jgi:hypothetical protein
LDVSELCFFTGVAAAALRFCSTALEEAEEDLCFLAFCCISVELKPEEEAEREGAA